MSFTVVPLDPVVEICIANLGCPVFSLNCRGQSLVYCAGSRQLSGTWAQCDEKEKWIFRNNSGFSPSLHLHHWNDKEGCSVFVLQHVKVLFCTTHKKDFFSADQAIVNENRKRVCLCSSFTSNSFAHRELFLCVPCLNVDYVRSLCVRVCMMVCVHINPV